MKIAIFDIETDNLLYDCKNLWCISIKVNGSSIKAYTKYPIKGSSGSVEEGIELLKSCDTIIGHNIINFDIPAIKKLTGVNLWDTCDVLDTLIASKLAYPNMLIIDSNSRRIPPKLKGRHSLKSWGYRLDILKGDYGEQEEAWDNLTIDMVEYCKQDVKVTYALYERLKKKNIPQEAIRLEQEFVKIIQRQEAYGWLFDIKKAEQLHIELVKDRDIATKELHNVFNPLFLPKGKEKTQDSYAKLFPFKSRGNLIVGSHQPITLTTFNPSSRQHISIWFKRWYNWTSPIQTDKGNPKIDESVLKTLDYKEAKILVHYFSVNKLLGQLAEGNQAWLKQIKDDGRIHGSVDTLGAVSRRCTHSKPNVAQVPSNRAYKGEKCRELFIVPEGKKLVGCDADGLELRTLSHYMAIYDKGRYAQVVDKGNKDKGTDVHTLNQRSAGLPNRDDAKVFIYAFLYGAGVDKLGSITGGGAKEGAMLKKKFLKKLPALEQLMLAVQKTVKDRGYLKALDANKFFIRSEHSALNTLLQGCGALVMKYYLVELDKNLEKYYSNSTTTNNPQYEFVGNIHDEVQIEVGEDIAEDVAKIAEDTFEDVTKLLKFRIPLRGTADIGDSWKDTH